MLWREREKKTKFWVVQPKGVQRGYVLLRPILLWPSATWANFSDFGLFLIRPETFSVRSVEASTDCVGHM